jgi:hypothetical protein
MFEQIMCVVYDFRIVRVAMSKLTLCSRDEILPDVWLSGCMSAAARARQLADFDYARVPNILQ